MALRDGRNVGGSRHDDDSCSYPKAMCRQIWWWKMRFAPDLSPTQTHSYKRVGKGCQRTQNIPIILGYNGVHIPSSLTGQKENYIKIFEGKRKQNQAVGNVHGWWEIYVLNSLHEEKNGMSLPYVRGGRDPSGINLGKAEGAQLTSAWVGWDYHTTFHSLRCLNTKNKKAFIYVVVDSSRVREYNGMYVKYKTSSPDLMNYSNSQKEEKKIILFAILPQ